MSPSRSASIREVAGPLSPSRPAPVTCTSASHRIHFPMVLNSGPHARLWHCIEYCALSVGSYVSLGVRLHCLYHVPWIHHSSLFSSFFPDDISRGSARPSVVASLSEIARRSLPIVFRLARTLLHGVSVCHQPWNTNSSS